MSIIVSETELAQSLFFVDLKAKHLSDGSDTFQECI
jgi:hypothetical protein